MLKRLTTIAICTFAISLAALSGQQSLNKNVYELPLFVDFELFIAGTNMSEFYPGWQEGQGFQQPQYAGSSFYGADRIHPSKTAAVSFTTSSIRDEWIISPQFQATETTKISFKAAVSRFWDEPSNGSFSQHDSVSVLISTNTEEFEFIHLVHTFKLGNLPGWELETYHLDLSEFAGELIHLAFYATNSQEPLSMAAFHLDDIEIKNAVPFDVMPLGVLSPGANQCISDNQSIVVSLRNDGLEDVEGIPLRIKFRGTIHENIYAIYQDLLPAGEETQFEAGSINLPYGEYTISVQTELENDTYHYNNIISGIELQHIQTQNLPLPFMNFMGFYGNNLGEVYPGWYEARGKNFPNVVMDTDWQGDTYNGVRVANVFFAGLGTNDWMISPIFNAGTRLTLEMKAAYQYYQGDNIMGSDDKLAIMVSTDCGASWEEVAAITQESNLDETLQNFTFEIEGFDNQNIKLALYATTGDVNDGQQYIIHITDVSIKSLFDWDAGVTQILSPGTSCVFGEGENVSVEIKNFGKETISNFNVAYSINEAEAVIETINESLDYNQTLSHTFSETIDISLLSEFTLYAYTLLENDENPDNDEISATISLSSYDLANDGNYLMGFEDHEDFSTWLVQDGNNDGVSWELYNDPIHANTGTNSFAYFSNQTSTTSNDWLHSPCFYLEEGATYSVSFFYKNRATNWPESLKLMLGTEQHSSTMTETLLDLGQISNSGFLMAEVSFSVEESGSYYFGWHAYGPPDQFGMHIDDISIRQVFDLDLAANQIKSEWIKDENCIIQAAEEIQLLIHNVGTSELESIDIALEINHGSPIHFTFPTTINPGEHLWLNLEGGFSLNPYESYHIKVYINNDDDQNPNNNALVLEEYIHSNFQTSFEEGEEELESWTIENLAGTNNWHIREGADQANSGSHKLAIRTDQANNNTANDDWAITDCFHLEAGKCYEISFYYRSWWSTENLAVFMGTDNNHQSMNIPLIDIPSFNSNAYLYANQQFSVEEDGVYHFGFHTDGGVSGRYFVFVDDLKIIENLGASPVASPEAHILDLEVFFQANAENYSNIIWDFGDGSTSSQTEVFHVYNEPGTYHVSLHIESGCVNVSYDFTLELNCEMQTDFDFSVEENLVQFQATGDAIAYFWDFGDGNTAWGQNVANTYETEESQLFDVTLTAYYACGEQTITKQIETGDETTTQVPHTVNVSDKISIYPNPANQFLNIESAYKIEKIEILDSRGRSLKTKTHQGSITHFDISKFNQGVYFIRVHTNGHVNTQKVQFVR